MGPITGLIFDRNSAKCRQESEEELPLCQQHPAAKRIKRMKESVLPFLLTNIFCLLISVLVMVQLKWALVSHNQCHRHSSSLVVLMGMQPKTSNIFLPGIAFAADLMLAAQNHKSGFSMLRLAFLFEYYSLYVLLLG